MTKQVGSVTVTYDRTPDFAVPLSAYAYVAGWQKRMDPWAKWYALILAEKLAGCVDDTITTPPRPLLLSVKLNGEKLAVTVSGDQLDMHKVQKFLWEWLGRLFENGRVADTVEAINREPKQYDTHYNIPPDSMQYSPHRPNHLEPEAYHPKKLPHVNRLDGPLHENFEPPEKEYIIPLEYHRPALEQGDGTPRHNKWDSAAYEGEYLNEFPEVEGHGITRWQPRDMPTDTPTIVTAVSASAKIVVTD